MSGTPEETKEAAREKDSKTRRASCGTDALTLDSNVRANGASSAHAFSDDMTREASYHEPPQRRGSSGQRSVRQKPTPKKGCLGKKKRKRLERILVLYGPNITLQKELLDRASEKFSDIYVLPPIVTTMPVGHPQIADAPPAHRFIHVNGDDFEKMFSTKELVCCYHMLESDVPQNMKYATEGQCTSASKTEDSRATSTLSNGRTFDPVFSDHTNTGDFELRGRDMSTSEKTLGTDMTQISKSESPPVPRSTSSSAVEHLTSEHRSVDSKTHMPPHSALAATASVPTNCAGSSTSGSTSSLRHTFYFGFQERTVREAMKETATAGVVTLLLPYEPAVRVLEWCSGRFPNVFISTAEGVCAEMLLRPENTCITDTSEESVSRMHEIYEAVVSAQRFDKVSYAEALTYFQSRQFLLERKAVSTDKLEKKAILNSSKIRLDRSLKPERDLVITVAGCAYNPEDAEHIRISRTVFCSLTKFGGSCPTTGRHWCKIGCATDSVPEAAGGGLMTYMHVLHLFANESLQSLVTDIFQLSEGGQRFKFMEVSSRLTQSVLLALYSSHIQKLCNQRQQIFGVLNDLYVGALLKFFEVFQCAITPPDINAMLIEIDGDIRQHSRRLMLSVDNHQQGYSFHAQVASAMAVLRTTSLTTVPRTPGAQGGGESPGSHASTPGAKQPVSLSNSMISASSFYKRPADQTGTRSSHGTSICESASSLGLTAD